MRFDWETTSAVASKGWQVTQTALWEAWQLCLLGLSFASNYIEDLIFAFSYNTPMLDYDRETGECDVMKLEYRIGSHRYCLFRRAEGPVPRVQRILGASLTYDPQHATPLDATPVGSLVIDVKHPLQEMAGPFQDFHGQKPKIIDIVKYLVSPEQRQGISNSDWMRHGKLRVTILLDAPPSPPPADVPEGSVPPPPPPQSKWVTRIFGMSDVLDYTSLSAPPEKQD